MTENMCQKFNNVWSDFSDSVDEYGNYTFNDDGYSTNLFTNKKCDNDIDKVNAVSFWLFVQNFGDNFSLTKNVDSNTNIFHYIMIWLIYTLKLKSDDKVMEFYNTCINPDQDYISSIKDTNSYDIYKDPISSKLYLMNRDIKDISKFYDALKSLCNMYNEFEGDNSDCTPNLDYA
ncbi:Plasmodium variant antigen protein Cir/Yir/Bir, putative, partial [Plasmodium chabaudi adami]